jgi:hypothetical protein
MVLSKKQVRLTKQQLIERMKEIQRQNVVHVS